MSRHDLLIAGCKLLTKVRLSVLSVTMMSHPEPWLEKELPESNTLELDRALEAIQELLVLLCGWS